MSVGYRIWSVLAGMSLNTPATGREMYPAPHPVVSIYPLMIKGQVWKLGMQKSTEKPAQALHPEFVQKRPRPCLQNFCRQRHNRTQGFHMKIRPVLCGHVCCLVGLKGRLTLGVTGNTYIYNSG